ncbi:LacI family DNA-binding transcriptional regulator [Sinorhizobium medicae]
MARRPTMKDVAAAADVAVMTVSYAFNQPDRVAEGTRLRVLEAARRLGYEGPSSAARALRSGRNGQIGVVLGEHLSYAFDDPQATQFLAGIADVCVSNDLGMVLIPTRGGEGDVDRVTGAAVDGYVLWTTTDDDPVLAAVARSGRPSSIQGGPEAEGITLVAPDDTAAAKAVATAVLSDDRVVLVLSFPLDRERRSFLALAKELPNYIPFPVTRNRLEGYREALDAEGYDWGNTVVGVVSRNQRAEARALVRQALPRLPEGPLVVLAMSDELALGAHDALEGEKRTFMLTGWDASSSALQLGILSVVNPLREQGRLCAQAALKKTQGSLAVTWSVVVP